MDPYSFCTALRNMDVEKVRDVLKENPRILWSCVPTGCETMMYVSMYFGYVLKHISNGEVQDERLKTIARLISRSLTTSEGPASPDLKAFSLLSYAVAAGWSDIILETVPLSKQIPSADNCRSDAARNTLAYAVAKKNHYS